MITADHLPYVRVFESLSGLGHGDLDLFGEIPADALEEWAKCSDLEVEREQIDTTEGGTPVRWTVCRCRTVDGFRINAHRDTVSLAAVAAAGGAL